LGIQNRPALILTLCACAVAGTSAPGAAFTLHRVAASLDIGRIASPHTSVSDLTATAWEQPALPATAALLGPTTEIEVRLPEASDVEIVVVDDTGTRVCDARVHLPAGMQKLGFCGRDAQGRLLANGVYYYSVIVGDQIRTTEITIAR
jgi:hypothetical protein